MNKTDDLVVLIKEQFHSMSKGHKQIAEYILSHYDKAAFMTAIKLGESAGVSESTIVRFAMALGFEGYPELQKSLQDMVRNKLTTIQRMDMNSELSQSMMLRSVLKADLSNMKMTIEELNTEIYEEIVDEVYAAKTVYIMGVRSSAPLAQFLGYYLNFILDNVRIVTSGINDILEQVIHIGEKDTLICISFPRYSRKVIEAVKFAKKRNASVVSITDSYKSPLTKYSKLILTAKSDIASFVDSLVAPMSLINALIVSIGFRKKQEVAEHFKYLEKIWDEYDVYIEKDDASENDNS
ncbi:MAG: MurR/RpiR family transcriptional regulator [Clostridia bacterium]|nr:MurR/RpiR family transcriptional regulator [Clostridia bacterium]